MQESSLSTPLSCTSLEVAYKVYTTTSSPPICGWQPVAGHDPPWHAGEQLCSANCKSRQNIRASQLSARNDASSHNRPTVHLDSAGLAVVGAAVHAAVAALAQQGAQLQIRKWGLPHAGLAQHAAADC